jgi:hypothetical protein
MIGKLKATSISTDIVGDKLRLIFELPINQAWQAHSCVGEANSILFSGKDLSVTIDKWTEKRSNDANAYAWTLLNKLGNKLALSPIEVYRRIIKDVPDANVIVPIADDKVTAWRRNWGSNGIGWQTEIWGDSKIKGHTNIICFWGSSTFNTTQMSRFIDLIIQECEQQDIETLPPDKLEAMVNAW